MSVEAGKAITLFYCYAREDEWLLNQLEKHLAPLRRQGYLIGWHDRMVEAGKDWRQEIEQHLSHANLILMLLSPDFVYSDACDDEMRRALTLHETGRAQVIPVLLRPVLWEDTALARLESLPTNGQPVTTWENQDQALHHIAFYLAMLVHKQLNVQPLSNQDLLLPFPTPILTSSSSSQPLIDDSSFAPHNPYRGLHAFTADDTNYFFGRDRLIGELLQTVQKIVSSSSQEDSIRLLSVIGPSGSGKSSVVRAGLVPALKKGKVSGSEHWIYLEPMIPGQDPLREMTRILSYQFPQRSLASLREDLEQPGAQGLFLLFDALSHGKAKSIFLYIDQFEELFLQTSEEERAKFITMLLTALTNSRSPVVLVTSLRADFYDRPMLQSPELFRLMQAAQVSVLPLNQRDLRDVIRKPALLPDVQLRFEDDLVGELLTEMRGQSGDLPLLEFTLDRLFHERRGQTLTLAAYHTMGGIQGALARHADATFASLRTEAHRTLARALLLCLIEPGTADQKPTRRRIVLSELALPSTILASTLEEVAIHFTDARLLTINRQDEKTTLEISHEALIRGWEQLGKWFDEARDDLYLLRRLSEDATTWVKQGHPVSRLYRDYQLHEAVACKQRLLFSHREEYFLQASLSEQEKQRLHNRQKEALQQKQYRRRTVLIGLGGLSLAAAATAAGIEWVLQHQPQLPPLQLPYSYQGHSASVWSVAWSPNSKHLASASEDGTVQIWDADSGQTLLTYSGHIGSTHSVAWSPDGTLLASAGEDSIVRVWDAVSGQTLLIYKGHKAPINSVAWSPDGKMLASASNDRTVRVWDANSGRTQITYSGHTDAVYSVAWSPDSKHLASTSNDLTMQIWDASSGDTLFPDPIYINSIYSVVWSPDGKHLASAGDDTNVWIWDISTGESALTCHGHTGPVRSVTWSSDGKHFASASDDKTVRIWDASTGQPLLTYSGHTSSVWGVAWSPDGTRLASASIDRTVRIWDANLKTGQTVYIYKGHSVPIYTVAWSPDGTLLASAGSDNTVQIWNASTGQTLLTYKGHSDAVQSVSWSPDGTLLASASNDQTVRLWNTSTGQPLLTYSGHTNTVRSVSWSPDGTLLASAGFDETVQIWNASTGQPLFTYSGHTDGVRSVSWSPDGTLLASASNDQTVRIWDTNTGQSLFTYYDHTDAVQSVSWSPDGTRLASASNDQTVRIWDADSGQTQIIYRGHSASVNDVSWSSNTKFLASASYDKTVRIWEASTGQTLLTYKGHSDSVLSVAWSPDGKHLASAGFDATVQIWLWLQG